MMGAIAIPHFIQATSFQPVPVFEGAVVLLDHAQAQAQARARDLFFK